MALAYRPVPRASSRIADRDPDPLTEAELSRVWAAQSFPPEALTLVDGRPLRIVLPGRPGGGSGPDYLGAIVNIEGVEYHGDIELHVRAGSFYDHGHHLDPAYDNLVLHVAFAADGAAGSRLHSGGSVPVAAFAPWVGQRTQELEDWLAAPPLWLEPCSDAAAHLGKDATLTVLAREGERRFDIKVARMRESVAGLGEEQALWLALLDTLGYGNDRASWRRLAERLPVARLRSLSAGMPRAAVTGIVQAALLATAGLASPTEELAACLPRPLSAPLTGGSRPASRPERRLRALAILWQRAGAGLPVFARRAVKTSTGLKDLTAAWTVADPFGGPALLGEQRARELLLNAALPFAAIDATLEGQARALSAKLPASPAYGKTAFLEANLKRADASLRARSAFQQQGLLAMVSNWCRQGGCGRCPLS